MIRPMHIFGKLASGFRYGLLGGRKGGGMAWLAWRRRPARTAVLVGGAFLAACLVFYVLIQASARGREMGTGKKKTAISSLGQGALAMDAGVREYPWTAIVLHHSATSGGNTHSFDRYHRTQMGWRSLGYHFVVGNGAEMRDGAVEAGPRWRLQQAGAHAHSREFNRNGIGICLVGNFERTRPTQRQIKATRNLVRELCRRFRIPASRIYGHGQIREGGSTACPGRYFPYEKIVEGL